jgi:hypothetical protein
MKKEDVPPTKDTSVTKDKKKRLATDKTMLEKLVEKLGKKPMTKQQLAEEMGIDNPKTINDSVILAAIKLTCNSDFLKNLVQKKAGKARKNVQYVEGRGLQITPWQFQGKNIPDKQRYRVEFNDKTKVITLHPTDDEFVKEGDE